MIAEAPLGPIWIVGSGRAGRALSAALATLGIEVRIWRGREAAAGSTPPPGPVATILLAVSDSALASLAGVLARVLPPEARVPVLHLSGAVGREVLAPLAAAGFPTGSCHPLQTFPESGGGLELFAGIVFGVEGEPPALRAAERLAGVLGAKAIAVPAERRALYHLAASLSANALVGLVGAATEALAAAGFTRRQALDALAPLARTALERSLAEGPAAALTGPVARGDRPTLERHRAALRAWDASRIALYEALVREQERLVGLGTGPATKDWV